MTSYLKEFWSDKRVLFLSFAFLVYFVIMILTPYTPWTWLAIAGGILFFFVIEYVTHRFVLHEFDFFMPKAIQEHNDHHDDPNNIAYMLTPNSYNVPLHIVFAIVFSLATWSVHLGCAVMVGVGAYQLHYEWTHYISHRPIVPKTPWGKNMKKFHLLHHYKSGKYWYGVTNSIFDSFVGTNPAQSTMPNAKDA